MKKQILLSILMIFEVVQAEFKKSQVQEWQEYAPFFCKALSEKVDKNMKEFFESQNPYFLLMLGIQEFKKNSLSLDQLPIFRIVHTLGLQTTFNRLKKLMNIPDEVSIVYCCNTLGFGDSDTIAGYHSVMRVITLSDSFFLLDKQIQLFCLIHELTHCQQHMRDGIVKFNSSLRYAREREADTQAMMSIQCPNCLWHIEKNMQRTAQHVAMGYLGKSDFKKARKKKSHNPHCDGCKKNEGFVTVDLFLSGVKFKKINT